MKRTMDELINAIKETGYWKVIIRPFEFEETKIANRDIAMKIIESNKISFRGWDYPHIDHRSGIVFSGSDSISSYCDWPEGGHFEFWKYYLNGQFVHYFSMLEDYEMTEKDKERANKDFFSSDLDQYKKRFLSIINALYYITEIFSFAANIAKQANYGDKTEIIIELGNVEGRTLFFWGDHSRILHSAYTCEYQPIQKQITVNTDELIKNPGDLSLDFTIELFKEFNWKNANKNVFVGDQKKLVERRF